MSIDGKKGKKPTSGNNNALSNANRDNEDHDQSTTCGECGKPEGTGESWVNCGPCGLWYHTKCQHIDKKSFDCINKLKENLIFVCNACKIMQDDHKNTDVNAGLNKVNASMNCMRGLIFKLMDEFNAFKHETAYLHEDLNALKLKLDNTQKIEKCDPNLNNMVKDLSSRVEGLSEANKSLTVSIQSKLESTSLTEIPKAVPQSFAEAAKMPGKNILVLKAHDEAQKASEQHKSVVKVLNQIPIADTRVTKSGHLLLELRDKKTLDSAMTILKQNEKKLKIGTSVKSKITPKICISNISELADLSSITDDIVNKNAWLKSLVSQGKKFEYVAKFKNKRESTDLVFKIDPEIRKCLRDRNDQILTPYSVCKIYDRYHVLQCYKCLGFNHTSKSCNASCSSCFKCSGNHTSSDCEAVSLCCKNCKTSEKSDHMANDKQCPRYLEEISKIRNLTDHGYDL